MAEINIVKELQVKNNEGLFNSPIPIGVDQFFVSSLRGSKTNNLEEQFILGADYVSTQWTEEDENTGDNVYVTVKEFYNAEDGKPSAYYKLETRDYQIDSSYSYLGQLDGEQTLIINTNLIPSEEDVTLDTPVTIQEQTLYYIKNNVSNRIAYKKTEKVYVKENNKVKKILKEEIINYLNQD